MCLSGQFCILISHKSLNLVQEKNAVGQGKHKKFENRTSVGIRSELDNRHSFKT